MGQGPATNPFAEGYTPSADTGMGDVAYAGGTPGFDMTGGMGGGMGGMGDTGGGMDFSGLGGFDAGAMAPQQPAFDMGAIDFSNLAGLGALGNMPQQMPELAPQPAPQQPAPDMGGFGMFGGGMDFSGLDGFNAGATAPQPAPSYDMSAFGGFGGMPQQPAPSFDIGGMGGGMDFGGGMDYSGMDFGSVGGFAGGGPIQYAAGGKFLRGPGDGMSDDIKANKR